MKRIIKKLIIRLFYYLSFVFRYKQKDLKVIYYHDIVQNNGYSYQRLNIDNFREQMEYLKNNVYKTLLFDDLEKINYSNVNGKYVLITFDDGWVSNYNLVFAIMKELDLKFNIFLEVGAIDNNFDYINWDMAKQMRISGLVGFGAHTFNHTDARMIMDDEDVAKEITLPNKIINSRIGVNVNDFCFPFGYYDNNIIEKIVDLNVYKRLYTSDGMRVYALRDGIDLIGRVGIENDDSLQTFIAK